MGSCLVSGRPPPCRHPLPGRPTKRPGRPFHVKRCREPATQVVTSAGRRAAGSRGPERRTCAQRCRSCCSSDHSRRCTAGTPSSNPTARRHAKAQRLPGEKPAWVRVKGIARLRVSRETSGPSSCFIRPMGRRQFRWSVTRSHPASSVVAGSTRMGCSTRWPWRRPLWRACPRRAVVSRRQVRAISPARPAERGTITRGGWSPLTVPAPRVADLRGGRPPGMGSSTMRPVGGQARSHDKRARAGPDSDDKMVDASRSRLYEH